MFGDLIMNNITHLGLLCIASATAFRLTLMHSLRINHDLGTTQLEALDRSRGDNVSIHALLALCTTGNTCGATQSTCAIKEVL